ncbi:MAG TPA: hypothetical protein VFX50_05995, partial [Gemmatimonadales bacterium]|nr:hypothetical protein [Gemmatimonadales bacterium]
MNNADQIAGEARIVIDGRGNTGWHAVVWLAPGDPAPLDLGAAKSNQPTSATAINDAGLVVGWLRENTMGADHAVAWRLP